MAVEHSVVKTYDSFSVVEKLPIWWWINLLAYSTFSYTLE